MDCIVSPKHHEFTTSNRTRVFFPFEPYETQKQFMDAVITALARGKNALLESPTGTGKTLSLLCSTLAWFQNISSKPSPMIYYASRTHMQLAQGAKEMKRTAYSKIPAVVLGGRAQMCLNDEVKSQATGSEHLINRACRNAIAKNACQFYSNYEQKLETANVDSVNDIEDLINFGRKSMCCPYYASKKLAEVKASVVFTPYNYLLSTQLRKALQLKLENSVIIFDEAHNIEDAFKDCVSGSISLTCINDALICIQKLPQKINNALLANKGITRYGYEPQTKGIVDELKQSKHKAKEKEPKVNPVEELAQKLTNEKLNVLSEFCRLLKSQISALKVGALQVIDFYQILNTCGCNYASSNIILETLDSAISFLQIAGVQNITEVDKHVTAMSNMFDSISLFFPMSCSNFASFKKNEQKLIDFYSIYIEVVENENKFSTWKIYFWCLNPALGLRQMIDTSCIEGVRSLIITSGTLAPMSGLIGELGTNFDQIREFPHVINKQQMKICILRESADGKTLESSKKFTDRPEYPLILGNSLLLLFKILPFGTVVFLQSYALLDRVLDYWKNQSRIFVKFQAVTSVYIESKNQSEFTTSLINYKKDVDNINKSKSVFIGVCRGKLSEGVNLEANYCRTVILTGLPFPRLNDPKVVFTRKYHSRSDKDVNSNGGDLWYQLQMQRALNQTIGRVIRSQSDFGLLLLCDPRFSRCKYSLSKWVQDYFPNEPTRFDDVEKEIKDFFANHSITIKATISNDLKPFRKTVCGDSSFESSKIVISNDVKKKHEERQARMIASYTVSQETLNEVRDKRKKDNILDEGTKKPKTTMDIFESLFTTSSSQNSDNSQDKHNYSILEQLNNKQRYRLCEICNNPPEGIFFRTHCSCAKAGCKKCLNCLDGKLCRKCDVILDKTKFKPCFFNSAKRNQK